MEVPDVIMVDCCRVISGCVDALHAAEELESLEQREKAEMYRRRALRQAIKVKQLLLVLSGNGEAGEECAPKPRGKRP